MKICVVGMGYVGLSLSTLFSRQHEVVCIDVIKEKVDMVNNHKSPIDDKEIMSALANDNRLRASLDISECSDAEFVIIATPTNYDPAKNHFDTSSVDDTVKKVKKLNPDCTIVIKSTIPIGYTKCLYDSGYKKILYSPEFLREGKALYDNLHPSRVIVGYPDVELISVAKQFCNLLVEAAEDVNVPNMLMYSTEAESVKLFSNTFLAMRVAFFNELDSFCENNLLNSSNVIRGVSLDPRIGDHYNNPSFGYGGYCLPKDTKQLLANYSGIPNSLIKAIVDSNDVRKKYIASNVIKKLNGRKTVGLYKIAMKYGSDNYRESSILSIADLLTNEGITIIVFDPAIRSLPKYKIETDIDKFIEESDVILTNRVDELAKERFGDKLYTRDIFTRD